MGLLLFRSRVVIKTRAGFGTLSLLMLLLFVGPHGQQWVHNWVYDLAMVTIALPLLVAVGAGATASGSIGTLCDVCGRISYPIYMVHYAVVMVFANYSWSHVLPVGAQRWLIGALTLGLMGFSYLVLVFYDEPVRKWLTSKWAHRPYPVRETPSPRGFLRCAENPAIDTAPRVE
jgi:peptidoglycan/LPS O-acetylase OafA/YrhL